MSITFEAATIPNMNPGETGYKLSTGDLAAVRFKKGEHAAPHMFSWKATARAVDAAGKPILNSEGQPIVVHIHAGCPKMSLIDGSTNPAAIKQEALNAVLTNEDGLAAECAAERAYLSQP
ncbi:MAG: hypothetical protein WBR15_02760 [Gammaproteobacteria bacterium]